MKPRSLRVRLLLSATAAIFVALAFAWVVMTLLFERHIERRVQTDLVREGMQLAANLSIGPGGEPLLNREPGDVRFGEPASGLYWQVTTSAGRLRSRSLWDQALPTSLASTKHEWNMRFPDGPFEEQLLLVERQVRPDRDGPDVLIQVASENKSLHESRREFGAELAVFLCLLWAILSAAAWAQVALGLKPLARIRDQVHGLKRSSRERLAIAPAREVEPLVNAINELADARENDLARARRRAANLAHALKTPLAAIAAQSRRVREAGAQDAADGLDRSISAASAAVDRELARSRAAEIRAAITDVRAPALPAVESVVGVVERAEFVAQLVFQVEVPSELVVPVAADDLLELMGVLIENAARYARRRVLIAGDDSAEGCRLRVEDDGPGIDPDQMSSVFTRGARLDESGGGHGLGLAIARDLAEATGAEISLSRSALGGLGVAIFWRKLTLA
ncbi:MAG TPA: sensor histidine kinase [Steroidobacteraceae bacterium]|nr:sensor histidine kinase [Steroidobacteraceae bacterium]